MLYTRSNTHFSSFPCLSRTEMGATPAAENSARKAETETEATGLQGQDLRAETPDSTGHQDAPAARPVSGDTVWALGVLFMYPLPCPYPCQYQYPGLCLCL